MPDYEDIDQVVEIRTNIQERCNECSELIGGEEWFAESINHYLQEHGYRLLHIGQQSVQADDGTLWSHTIAIVGIG